MFRSVLDKIWGDWRVMLAVLSLLCVVVFAVQTIVTWYRLRQFKGPFPATFSNLWLVRALLNGRMNFDMLEASRKYGSFCRGLHTVTCATLIAQGPWFASDRTC